MSKPFISYSQNFEDMILEVLLHSVRKGFYVDVGANHAILHSVTKHFYDKGWSGINIEPNVLLYRELKKARRRDINLNVGVSGKEGELLFRQYPYHDGFSTFSREVMALRQKQGIPHEDIKVPVVTLKKIFDDHKVERIDFMKVDVEGYEYEVLESNDWSKYKPKVLVIEGLSKKWLPLIKKQGYKKVFYDGLNQYFVHESARECNIKNYPNVLLSYGYISHNENLLRKENARLKEQQVFVSEIMKNPSEYIGLRRLTRAAMKRSLKVLVGRVKK